MNHNHGDTAAAYISGSLAAVIARLVEIHFFETLVLAVLCGFLGTFAKNAGAAAWQWFSGVLKRNNKS